MGKITFAATDERTAAFLLDQAQRTPTTDPAAWHGLGKSLNNAGAFELSQRCLAKAYELAPDNPVVLRSYGLSLWRSREIATGLALYDAGRFGLESFRDIIRPFPHQRWDGQDIRGKKILLWAEQGVGDQIMQARCLDEIAESAGGVTLECDPRLHPLFSRSFPNVTYKTAYTTPLPELMRGNFDYQSSLLSAWRWTWPGKTNSVAVRDAYLLADQRLADDFSNMWSSLGHNLNVGISWRSGAKGANGGKNLDLVVLRAILANPNVTFHSLQYDCDQQELAGLMPVLGRPLAFDSAGDARNNLDRLAAQIKALDLVITISNVTAEIAGAVGTHCWVLLPASSDWRWGTAAGLSDLYPNMKLYRKTDPTNWIDTATKVVFDLQDWVDAHA